MEIECCIGDLFEAISRSEGIKFEIDNEYFQEEKIELMDEKSKWCNVPAMITKTDYVREIAWSNGSRLQCAAMHRLHAGSGYTRFAKDIKPGDEIHLANGRTTVCISNDELSDDEHVLYDLQIDTPSHLYQTSDGIVHHNTLIAQSIARFLDVPFTIADATSLTESGLNAGPFIS